MSHNDFPTPVILRKLDTHYPEMKTYTIPDKKETHTVKFIIFSERPHVS